jgi:hypothetical protein
MDGRWFLPNVDGESRRNTNEKPRRKAGLCDTVHDRAFGSKAGEAIRTPDIHVGNVTLYH